MRRIRGRAIGVALLVFVAAQIAAGQARTAARPAAGEHFANKAGWSVEAPPRWKVACEGCSETTAADTAVEFLPPGDAAAGWVKISRLTDKPAGMALDTWLTETKATANFNLRLKETRLTVNGMPSLRVRYHDHETGQETDITFVVAGLRTFALEFTGQMPGRELERMTDYPAYLHMVGSFHAETTAP